MTSGSAPAWDERAAPDGPTRSGPRRSVALLVLALAVVLGDCAEADAQVEAIRELHADLDPDPASPDRCRALSYALGFDAVPWAGP